MSRGLHSLRGHQGLAGAPLLDAEVNGSTGPLDGGKGGLDVSIKALSPARPPAAPGPDAEDQPKGHEVAAPEAVRQSRAHRRHRACAGRDADGPAGGKRVNQVVNSMVARAAGVECPTLAPCPCPPAAARSVWLIGLISLVNDSASEMMYPLIPLYLSAC